MSTATNVTNWKNVNNWHWVEKNCLPWAKQHITSKLSGLSSVEDETSVSITKVNVVGDVHVNQRKGKIISIFDINITLNWEGASEEEEGKGKIEVIEFEHDTASRDIQIQISSSDSGATVEKIVALIKKDLAPRIRDILANFGPELREEHANDVVIPAEEMRGHPVLATYQPKPPAPEPVSSTTTSSTAVKGALVTVKQTIEFTASASDLFDALTNPQKIDVWTRSRNPVSLATPGSPFQLFGGNVAGEYEEIEKGKRIVQKWRLKTWPEDHYSKVVMDFEEGRDTTTLKLTQTDVPVGEKDITEANWQNYYWNAIKATFGYGAFV